MQGRTAVGSPNNPGTPPRARGVYQARPTEAVAQDSILAGIGNVRQPHSWLFQCRRPARTESPRGCRLFAFLAAVRMEESRMSQSKPVVRPRSQRKPAE